MARCSQCNAVLTQDEAEGTHCPVCNNPLSHEGGHSPTNHELDQKGFHPAETPIHDLPPTAAKSPERNRSAKPYLFVGFLYALALAGVIAEPVVLLTASDDALWEGTLKVALTELRKKHDLRLGRWGPGHHITKLQLEEEEALERNLEQNRHQIVGKVRAQVYQEWPRHVLKTSFATALILLIFLGVWLRGPNQRMLRTVMIPAVILVLIGFVRLYSSWRDYSDFGTNHHLFDFALHFAILGALTFGCVAVYPIATPRRLDEP